MTGIDVAIVDTGSANLASVVAAFQRVGARPTIISSVAELARARRVVLPGVGAFGDVMSRLRVTGIAPALKARIEDRVPLLAICLGLQLLADESAEAAGSRGLGVVAGRVERLRGNRVPQLGWNRVDASSGASLVESGFGYFANSFVLRKAPADWSASIATFDGTFVSSLERGAQLACQFHPELSGDWGARLIERWYRAC